MFWHILKLSLTMYPPFEHSLLPSFSWSRRRKGSLPKSLLAFRVVAARTSGLVNRVFFSRQTGFSSESIRLMMDLKIRGRDKLRRLPEVNLHNEACAHEAQTRVLAVLVSPRTPFSLFCRRLENVSIRGLFSPTIRRYRFPFQIFWPWCFLRSYSSRFLSEIFRNEKKRP